MEIHRSGGVFRGDEFETGFRSKGEMAAAPIILDCACLQAHARSIDRIARLQLAAKQKGLRVQLKNVDGDLLALVRLCGLAVALGVESGRQTK